MARKKKADAVVKEAAPSVEPKPAAPVQAESVEPRGWPFVRVGRTGRIVR